MDISTIKVPFCDLELHRIKSGRKDQYCFGAKEVAKSLGYKDIASAIRSADLMPDLDYIVLEKANCPKNIWDELTAIRAVTLSSPRTTIIYESGFWKLSMKCTLEYGTKLRNWLASDVLPSIRQTGSYSIASIGVTTSQLVAHSAREVQIENSKTINALMYEKKGVDGVIKYNVENCKQVTGKTPKQIQKTYGRPSKSAKEILRKTDPAKAMTMSVNDYLVAKTQAELKNLEEVDKHLIKAFEEMSKLGIVLIPE